MMTRYLQIVALVGAVLALIYFSAIYFIPEIYSIISSFFFIFIPFIIAGLLALLMEPVIRWFTNKTRMTRPLAVAVSMLVIFGSLGFLSVLAVSRLVRELIDLSESLPQYVHPVQQFIVYSIERSKLLYFSLPPEVAARVNENLSSITATLSTLSYSIADFLVGFATALPGALLGIVVAFVATYFFSRDRRALVDFWIKLAPSPWGEKSLAVAREIARAFLSYIRAQAFLVSLTTVQAIAGLYLIGANYALTVGFLIGLFDMIPVLGPATIIIPWAIWSLISGKIALGVQLIILYLFIWIVRQILEARVVAANLGLHPLAVLMAMYVGLKLIGVAGLIFGPVTLIAVQAAYKAMKHEV